MADRDRPGFLDDLPDLDLDNLPDLELSDSPGHRVQKPRTELDPVRKLMALVPPCTEAKRERLYAVCRRICEYFMTPAIKETWLRYIEQIATSTGPALIFETPLRWPDDKAKFYAVMAVCMQRCSGEIVVIPERIQQTDWYKSHITWVPEYVCGMDIAPQLLDYIEHDLRKQGLLDDGQSGESNATQRSAKAKRKQRPKKPGRSPKYTPKQKALAKKRFEDLMASGHQVSEAWAIVAEEHGFPSGDAARKRCT